MLKVKSADVCTLQDIATGCFSVVWEADYDGGVYFPPYPMTYSWSIGQFGEFVWKGVAANKFCVIR